MVKIRLKNGQEFDRCPKAWLHEDAKDELQLISDHSWLKRFNILPNEGGKLAQDPRFVEAVDIIEAELARLNNNG